MPGRAPRLADARISASGAAALATALRRSTALRRCQQRLTGARLFASPAAAGVFATGAAGPGDPQAGMQKPFPAARVDRILKAGDSAHIPRDVVHGTYNAGSDTLVFLAILSPAKFEGPALVDVHTDEPWRSLKKPMVFDE